MSEHYTSFIREYKDLRYYMNPLTVIYSSGKFVDELLSAEMAGPRAPIGEDAFIVHNAGERRKIVVLVVGEAMRADHWSLNGYERNTNPVLSTHNIINLPEARSCATSTAYTLPCMFSSIPVDDFRLSDAKQEQNVLDVLHRAGVNVLWRDNNSDSKGVAEAVTFGDFRSPDVNPVCVTECRDIGMLSGLDEYIATHPQGDIVIVLHQMGYHGPAYYKRYPKEYEIFTPVCETNQIEDCSRDEINNAYDNALLYSDYFLGGVINFLKPLQKEFSTAMMYMADHGESLGDVLASKKRDELSQLAQQEMSHHNYFHTELGMLNVSTKIYDPKLGILAPVKFQGLLAWPR